MAVIVSIESEPMSGKALLCNILCKKGNFRCGNEDIGETLGKNLISDFSSWVFEYCLSKILSATPVDANRVVYTNLYAKHTLVKSLHLLKVINDNQFELLSQCCDLCLGHLQPTLVLYGSSDIQNPDTRCNSKTEFFLKKITGMRRVYRNFLAGCNVKVIRINSEYPYSDGVIMDRIANTIETSLQG